MELIWRNLSTDADSLVSPKMARKSYPGQTRQSGRGAGVVAEGREERDQGNTPCASSRDLKEKDGKAKMSNLPDVLKAALSLEVRDRAALAERLLASLEHLPEEEVERLWAEEAQRRLEEYRTGRAQAVQAEDVHKKAKWLGVNQKPWVSFIQSLDRFSDDFMNERPQDAPQKRTRF